MVREPLILARILLKVGTHKIIICYLFDLAVQNGTVPEARVDDMIIRILTPWFLLGQNEVLDLLLVSFILLITTSGLPSN